MWTIGSFRKHLMLENKQPYMLSALLVLAIIGPNNMKHLTEVNIMGAGNS